MEEILFINYGYFPPTNWETNSTLEFDSMNPGNVELRVLLG